MLTDKINLSQIRTQTNYLKTIVPAPLKLINSTRDASAMSGGQELLYTGKERSPTHIIQLQGNSEMYNRIFPLKSFVSWTFCFLKAYKSKCMNTALLTGKAKRYIAMGKY